MSIDINMSVKSYSGTKVESVTTTYDTPSTIANCLSTLMPFNVTLSSNRLSVKPTSGKVDNDEQRQQINLILTHKSDINSHFGAEPSNAYILDDKLKITMIDVNHGDCILIQTPSIPGSPGQNILFDCGGGSDNNNFVAKSIKDSVYNNNSIRVAYTYSWDDQEGIIGYHRATKALKRYGITKIDKLIITHAHEDHDGGLRNNSVVNPAKVGCLYDTGLHSTKGLPNVYTNAAVNSAISDYQILRSVSDSTITKLASLSSNWIRQTLSTDSSSVKKITVQNTLDFGGGVTFTVLWPNQKTMEAASLFHGPSTLKSTMISYIKEKTFGNKSMTFWHDGLEEDVYKNIMLSGSIKGTVTNGTLSANVVTLSGNPKSSITATLASDSTKQYILAELTGMTLNGIKQNDAFGDSQCWLNSIPSDGTIGGTMQCSVQCQGIGLIGSDFSGTVSQGSINLGTFEGHIRNNKEIAVMDNGGIDDINTISIIGKLQYKNFSMLLTGDAIFASYRRMMYLHDKSKYYGCDVLKGAHHGINVAGNLNNESLTMASLGHKYVMWSASNSGVVPGIDPETTILLAGRMEQEIIYNKNNKPSGDIPDSIIADGEVKPYPVYPDGYNATLVPNAIVCPRYDATLAGGYRSGWCNPYISTLYAHYKANVPLSNMFTTRFNKDITIITNGYQYSFITAKQLSRWPAVLRDSHILSWYGSASTAAKARPGHSSYNPNTRANILKYVRTGTLSRDLEAYNFH